MKMANILIVTAFCIPFISCGKSTEPQEKILRSSPHPTPVIEPIQIEEEEMNQIMVQRQEPVQKRVEDKLLDYCVDKLAEIEVELKTADGKYARYLKAKKKALLERCVDRYK